MTGAASAHQAATATDEDTSQQRAGRRRRISTDLQRVQQGATVAAAAAPAAQDSLSRLQQLADASPRVAQLRRLQALADGRFAPVTQLAGGPEEEELIQGKFAAAQLHQAPCANNTGLPDQLKSGIESLSGLSMDYVRVHFGSLQPAQGRVQPTTQMKIGASVNDDSGFGRVNIGSPAPVIAVVKERKGEIRQLLKVSDDHVRSDLRHEKASKLFTDATIEDIESRAGGKISNVSNQVLEAAVKSSRENNEMEYMQLSAQMITSEKQMTTFLNNSPDDEHMYVLKGGDLHVAIRAQSKKLPHPTLIGGDPDVDCAGSLQRSPDGTVLVTRESGHFRPPSVSIAQQAVDKMMKKSATKSFKKIVKGKKKI